VDGRREQPQDVEFVGDDASVREEAVSEALVRVAQVSDDEADVVAAGNVGELRLHLTDGAPLDQLEETPVRIVDDHGDELPKSSASSTEEVFVEAHDFGPRIEPVAPLELELLVQRAVDVAAREVIRASHLGEVAEVLAGPQQAAP